MTILPKSVVIAALAIAFGIALYEAHRAARLGSELEVLHGQNASLAAQLRQRESEGETAAQRAARAEPLSNASDAVNSELLRLRGEVGLLRGQLAAGGAQPQAATNQMSFTTPYLPRASWSDQGTDKPLNMVLTMFWALRQGDESKLEQMVSRGRDSQTLDDLIYPRREWEKIRAIQVVDAPRVRVVSPNGVALDSGHVDVIVEKALGPDGAEKDVSMERWYLIKVNDQWLITGYH